MTLLVFSDLDGTLLDHDNYSWSAAIPALERLRDLNAGLVLASSKTAAEMRPLQQSIGCDAYPAIVENGAGVLWPDDDPGTDKQAYQAIRDHLANLPRQLNRFTGFGDMSVADIQKQTGLDPQGAALAKQRQFSEPGLWLGSENDLNAFLTALQDHGIHARRGGRFLTLSFGQTKADAMRTVIETLNPTTTIALGDAPNDVEMIEAADVGVIVSNPHASPLPRLPSEDAGTTIRTTLPGPAGWAQAILHLTRDMKSP